MKSCAAQAVSVGEIVAQFESLPPIRLTDAPAFYRCEAGWNWKPQPLKNHVLWLVLEGRGTLNIDGRSVVLSAGTGFIFAPAAAPRCSQDEAQRLRIFACPFSFAKKTPGAWQNTQKFALHNSEWFLETAQRACALFAREDAAHREYASKLVETLVWHIAAENTQGALSARAKATETSIERTAAAIREAPGERWLVGEMSREAELSPSQFTRKFTEYTGHSPAHFVILTRLERAKHLLRETGMTVSAIAGALGYHDVHFFCRQFKNFTGTTPGSLRK